jgi:solute:Na+ symporter, SSS family
MHHENFGSIATSINGSLLTITNTTVRQQMTVPIVLSHILPIGIKGALCAVVLVAFISVHDTYLHSWGSIFVQDIIVPLLKKPLEPKQHVRFLRMSCIGVAIFIFCFSLLYRQTEAIFMFFALTGAIYMGGSGAVLIGGLYWKRGTTLGAYGAMITGSSIAIGSFVLRQIWPTMTGHEFPINSQWIYAITMIASVTAYVVLSLSQNRIFNMDKMLHRAAFSENNGDIPKVPQKGRINRLFSYLGLSSAFTRWDKALFYMTFLWGFIWWSIFVCGSLYNLVFAVSDERWMKFWIAQSWITFVLGFGFTIWFAVGGIRDIKAMLRDLADKIRDYTDDGFIQGDAVLDNKNNEDNSDSKVLSASKK